MSSDASAPGALVKTLMPEDTIVASDDAQDRFTNRDNNANMVQLKSKFVSKEVC